LLIRLAVVLQNDAFPQYDSAEQHNRRATLHIGGEACMSSIRTLHVQVVSRDRATPLAWTFDSLICGGYSERYPEALQRHVEERRARGLEAPHQTPLFCKISPHQARTAETVEVRSGHTSGEVECVLLCEAGAPRWITVGSDHTDRDVEPHSPAAAPQMYPKILAATVWPLAEVLPHWDALMLRSWVYIDGVRQPYQEDTLQAMLTPADLLAAAVRACGAPALQQAVVFSGTLATLGGELLYGEYFEMELLDPVLGRRIQHRYAVHLRA
jgi:hypothetical protein